MRGERLKHQPAGRGLEWRRLPPGYAVEERSPGIHGSMWEGRPRGLWNQIRHLLGGGQSSRLGSIKDDVLDGITVSIPSTAHLVISVVFCEGVLPASSAGQNAIEPVTSVR